MTGTGDLAENDKRVLCRIDIGVTTFMPCNWPAVSILRNVESRIEGAACRGHRDVRLSTGFFEIVEELTQPQDDW